MAKTITFMSKLYSDMSENSGFSINLPEYYNFMTTTYYGGIKWETGTELVFITKSKRTYTFDYGKSYKVVYNHFNYSTYITVKNNKGRSVSLRADHFITLKDFKDQQFNNKIDNILNE